MIIKDIESKLNYLVAARSLVTNVVADYELEHGYSVRVLNPDLTHSELIFSPSALDCRLSREDIDNMMAYSPEVVADKISASLDRYAIARLKEQATSLPESPIYPAYMRAMHEFGSYPVTALAGVKAIYPLRDLVFEYSYYSPDLEHDEVLWLRHDVRIYYPKNQLIVIGDDGAEDYPVLTYSIIHGGICVGKVTV